MVVSFGVLTMGTTDLYVVLVGNSLELLLLLTKVRQVDVYTCAKGSTKVGRA